MVFKSGYKIHSKLIILSFTLILELAVVGLDLAEVDTTSGNRATLKGLYKNSIYEKNALFKALKFIIIKDSYFTYRLSNTEKNFQMYNSAIQ